MIISIIMRHKGKLYHAKRVWSNKWKCGKCLRGIILERDLTLEYICKVCGAKVESIIDSASGCAEFED